MKPILEENETPAKPKNIFFYATVSAIIMLVSIFLTGSLIFLLQCGCHAASNDKHLTSTYSTQSEIIQGNIMRIVSRDEWLAVPANELLDKLELPVHRVIISHTATEHCNNQSDCILRVRAIQNVQMKGRAFSDIAYNFLVGGDGNVYEGRGWDQQGAHTKGYNVDSVGISFIGTFNTVKPSEKQLNAAKLIIAEGVRLHKLVDDYRLYGSLQFGVSDSMGSALYEEVKKWPNWSSRL